MRSYDRGSLGERGFREWDLALPDGEADGAFDELSSEFEFLREYVATFGQLNLPVARFLLRHRDRWWRIAFARVDAAPEAAEGPGSALARVSVSAGYDTAAPGELSPREVEIATLITAGLADKEIALRLGTSPRTVSTQISRLLARHKLPTRTSLAAVITGEGWCLLPVPGPVLRDLTLPAFILDAAMRAPKSPGMLERRRMTAPASPLVSTGRVTRAPLRVGLLVTSGAFSDDGLEAAHGAELALAQATRMYRGANARAFEPIRIAVDPLSPESVAQGLRQLAAEDVDAVMSTYASALDPTIFEFAAEYGRPFLHTNSWTDSARRVAQEPTRFAHTFQTSPTELSYTSGLMTYLRRARDADQLRTPKVSIIELDGFGCSLTAGNIHDELAAAGIAVGATVAVGLAVESPAQVAERALRSDPGLVIVSHLSVDVAIELQRALRAISQHTPVFHLYTPSIPRFFEELGEDGDGVIWSTITGRTQDLLGQRFSEGYRREFGAAPGWSQSSAAYDQAQLLAQGFLLSGSRHAADVSDTLRHIVHRGVNGTYALGGPGQTVAGYPFDSPDPTLTTPTVTYRYAGGQMTVIA